MLCYVKVIKYSKKAVIFQEKREEERDTEKDTGIKLHEKEQQRNTLSKSYSQLKNQLNKAGFSMVKKI